MSLISLNLTPNPISLNPISLTRIPITILNLIIILIPTTTILIPTTYPHPIITLNLLSPPNSPKNPMKLLSQPPIPELLTSLSRPIPHLVIM